VSNAKAPAAAPDAGPRQTPAKIALFAGVAVGMTILDQVTKIWVRDNMVERSDRIVVVDDFLNIVHAENPGAAFGFLNDSPYRMWVFAAFTVIALVVLFRMFLELPDDDRFQNVALGMIVSGAIGNAIDRVLYQSVTDMIDMYVAGDSLGPWIHERFGTTHWPTCNVADVAIVLGLIMFGIHFLFLEKDEDEVEHAPPEKALDEDAPPPAADGAAAPAVADAAEGADEDEPTDESPDEPTDESAAAAEDVEEGATELAATPQFDDFAEQKTETLAPVEPAPKKNRNLADLGKD
jgi:signal peptidase II